MRARFLLTGILCVGCTTPEAGDLVPTGEESSCAGVSRAALTAVDRKIVGAAAPYAADGTLRGRDAELAASQRKRREVAWDVVAKVLASAPLAEALPNGGGLPTSIPAWQTWYDKGDLRRIFHRLYEDLSFEQKQDRAHFAASDLDDTFLWNTSAVDELPTWPIDRYLSYLDAIDEDGEVAGLGGISRVSYSPAAARHLLQSYPEVLACRSDGTPPAHHVGPMVETPLAREAVEAAACEVRVVGSYAIGEDESLHAMLENGDGARLTLRAGDETCQTSDFECEIFGPATVDVRVAAGASPVRAVVSLTRRSTQPKWAACLDEAFPIDAVVVKADYHRADFQMSLPVYETSANALASRLDGDFTWDGADGEADPAPSEIYTLTLPNGTHYRLAALHIMTKELDHWLWTTLWWSPSPAEDFGADRPAAVEALGGPWGNYKMCVASAFEEGDDLAGGGFAESHPTLGEALAATYGGVGSPSWCSNPYLERGQGNAGTNCIGCHQHGGTELLSEGILELGDRGRRLIRNNFPTDYSWATAQGDDLATLFADEELYFLGAP